MRIDLSELDLDLVELALLDAIEMIRQQEPSKENEDKKNMYLALYNKIVKTQITN